jgi:ankyrin repeat protein
MSLTPQQLAQIFNHARLYGTLAFNNIDEAAQQEALSARDDRNRTLLHYLAMHGFESDINEAVRLGADLEATDNHGNTPLLTAASYNLLARSTLFDCITPSGNGPNKEATNNNNEAWFNILGNDIRDKRIYNAGVVSDLLSTTLKGDYEKYNLPPIYFPNGLATDVSSTDTKEDVQLKTFALNICNTDGFSPEELLIMLLHITDDYGKTPLQIAAETGQLAWVKALLKAGANPHLLPQTTDFAEEVEESVQGSILAIINKARKSFKAPDVAAIDASRALSVVTPPKAVASTLTATTSLADILSSPVAAGSQPAIMTGSTVATELFRTAGTAEAMGKNR